MTANSENNGEQLAHFYSLMVIVDWIKRQDPNFVQELQGSFDSYLGQSHTPGTSEEALIGARKMIDIIAHGFVPPQQKPTLRRRFLNWLHRDNSQAIFNNQKQQPNNPPS